ncbi:hypothetical protein HDU67_005945 [Dinochytrium kinnereticum]|nr:hypothetical protein HDU67_005945 [Dinochytrium kinnereticum]
MLALWGSLMGLALAMPTLVTANGLDVRGVGNVTLIVALPYGVNDITGSLDIDADSYRIAIFGMHVAAMLSAEDLMEKYAIPQGFVDFVPVNTWNPEFGSEGSLRLIDSGGYASDAIYESINNLQNVAEELKQAAAIVGVNVVTISIGDDVMQTNEFRYHFDLARRQKCHFIFASMGSADLNEVYHVAVSGGLVGPNYLWTAYNSPSPLGKIRTMPSSNK